MQKKQFTQHLYLHCQNSLPQSKGIHHHQGRLRRGLLQRYHTGRTRCYFQSPPGRYAAHSSPGWTAHGSASALQGKRARQRPKQSITECCRCSQNTLKLFQQSLNALHFLEMRCNTFSFFFFLSSAVCVGFPSKTRLEFLFQFFFPEVQLLLTEKFPMRTERQTESTEKLAQSQYTPCSYHLNLQHCFAQSRQGIWYPHSWQD